MVSWEMASTVVQHYSHSQWRQQDSKAAYKHRVYKLHIRGIYLPCCLSASDDSSLAAISIFSPAKMPNSCVSDNWDTIWFNPPVTSSDELSNLTGTWDWMSAISSRIVASADWLALQQYNNHTTAARGFKAKIFRIYLWYERRRQNSTKRIIFSAGTAQMYYKPASE